LPKYSESKAINRIIDANINRTKEGLRVCEEIARFMLNSPKFTSGLKEIRHEIGSLVKRFPPSINLLREREILKDVGRDIYINELNRKDIPDVFYANIQRVKESIRVLEEFTKLINRNLAVRFKKARYSIYEIEKNIAKKLSALSDH